MTSVWDEVQEFLRTLRTLKDPELFATGIVMISDLVDEIHELDHAMQQTIAAYLDRTIPMRAVRELNRKLKGGLS